MRRQLFITIFFVLVFSSASFCSCLSEERKREYGVLESAVTFSSDKVIGKYGNNIPDDFLAEKFMNFIKDKIPKDYYEVLGKYRIEISPKRSYYLLLVFEPRGNRLILFDYSCTPEVDGPVLLKPGKYNLDNLELYNQCRHN